MIKIVNARYRNEEPQVLNYSKKTSPDVYFEVHEIGRDASTPGRDEGFSESPFRSSSPRCDPSPRGDDNDDDEEIVVDDDPPEEYQPYQTRHMVLTHDLQCGIDIAGATHHAGEELPANSDIHNFQCNTPIRYSPSDREDQLRIENRPPPSNNQNVTRMIDNEENYVVSHGDRRQTSPQPLEAVRGTVLRRTSLYRDDVVSEDADRGPGAGTRPPEHPYRGHVIQREDVIKILKPCEINNKNLSEQIPISSSPPETDLSSRDSQNYAASSPPKYRLLKEHLLYRHQYPVPTTAYTKPIEDVCAEKDGRLISDDSVLLLDRFCGDPENHRYDIAGELLDVAEGDFSTEDAMLRCRVIIFLWILLGDRRMFRTGYPSADIHLVLWRVVYICCSVAGVKSAAAVPLPDSHNCGGDMLCFRDHVHRFLEVCAPTRDHWKQFGWASLTVDAVMDKIYKQELQPVMLDNLEVVPIPIRLAMRKLAHLEREEVLREAERELKQWRQSEVDSQSQEGGDHVDFRTVVPKRKRGRPVKVKPVPSDTGRIQRVMLWKFILNLLEEPGNEECIRWVKREEGIFRILNTDWLARIWGRRHGNPRMTYEKMARAMRTYYRSKVLQPVPRARNLPRKLIYRFNPTLIRKISNNRVD